MFALTPTPSSGRPPTLRLHTSDLLIDNFAGGGGASTGIEWALGRSPDIAINHDPEAIAMHAANHPATQHFCESVWKIAPEVVCAGRRVALAWFSPDCTFHSKARGAKPFRDRDAAKRRRGLAWVVIRWARAVKPRVICLENVEEFADWGPLLDDGSPDPLKRGFTFRRWVAQLRNCGYDVEARELRACDYGAPTTRRRLFIVARSDGQPIVWPEPTHGRGRLPARAAAECIDWSLPCPSIFDRKRPLAEATLRRIARGLRRYIIDSPDPFIVPMMHHGGERSVLAPILIQTSWGERAGQAPRCLDIHKPLGTVMAGGGKHALVSAFLAKHYGGHESPGTPLPMPFDTVTTIDHHALVSSQLIKYQQNNAGHDASETLHAATAEARVRAFMIKYYGTDQDPQLRMPLHTITTKDRFALVTVHGEQYVIADIGMRMLEPAELFRAQSFPSTYRIAIPFGEKMLSKSAQTRMCGNSVPPVVAEAIVRAQFAEHETAGVPRSCVA